MCVKTILVYLRNSSIINPFPDFSTSIDTFSYINLPSIYLHLAGVDHLFRTTLDTALNSEEGVGDAKISFSRRRISRERGERALTNDSHDGVSDVNSIGLSEWNEAVHGDRLSETVARWNYYSVEAICCLCFPFTSLASSTRTGEE